jgi:quinol monooxygenase YgiN
LESFTPDIRGNSRNAILLRKQSGFRHQGKYLEEQELKSMNLTLEIKARPGKFKELLQALQALISGICKEEECRDCRLYRDLEQQGIFSLSVHWKTLATLEHYMQSSSGAALLGAIDLLAETARVRLDDAPWEGIDVLRSMKKKQ